MMSSKSVPKTIVLKSPDSEKIREIIITSVLLPKSEYKNNINRVSIKPFSMRTREDIVMNNQTCKRRLDHLTQEEKIQRK